MEKQNPIKQRKPRTNQTEHIYDKQRKPRTNKTEHISDKQRKPRTNQTEHKPLLLTGIQKQLVDKYIHFIPETHHYLLFSILSDDVQFIHFHIFAVWFMSNCNIHHLDFISLFQRFKHIPFHSFIIHIINTKNTDIIPFIIDF